MHGSSCRSRRQVRAIDTNAGMIGVLTIDTPMASFCSSNPIPSDGFSIKFSVCTTCLNFGKKTRLLAQ